MPHRGDHRGDKHTIVGRIQAVNYGSTTCGPLERTEVFFQGCSHSCLGCFSPETHDPEGGREVELFDLYRAIDPEEQSDGFPPRLSICGGEPFDQSVFLVNLLGLTEYSGQKFTRLVYTGYSYEDILKDDYASKALRDIDMLVTGEYDSNQDCMSFKDDFVGSENQEFHIMFNGLPFITWSGSRANSMVRHTGQAIENVCRGLQDLSRTQRILASINRGGSDVPS